MNAPPPTRPAMRGGGSFGRVASGVGVPWPQAIVQIPAVAIGGWSGVWVAKRVPQAVMRWLVITVGLLLAVYYFVTG